MTSSARPRGSAPLVVVTGTGTEVGKTHLSEALILALGATGDRVVGLKPIESGVPEGEVSDAVRLDRVSTFHVQHTRYALPAPVSPHLAARQVGIVIETPAILAAVADVRRQADIVIVELPGGLFTPLAEPALGAASSSGLRPFSLPSSVVRAVLNVDLARSLEPDAILLVAPNRLGVLHDVLSVLHAVAPRGPTIDVIVLMAPRQPDASSVSNPIELTRLLPKPPVIELPRASPLDLQSNPDLRRLARRLVPRTRDGRRGASRG